MRKLFSLRFEETICIVLFIIMFIVVFLQVFFRYALNYPLSWPEELARYLFIWITFLGASMGVRRNTHISVEYFTNLLPPKLRNLLALFVYLSITFFLLVLIWQGWELTKVGKTIPTAAMEIPWMYIYFAVPISSFLMVIYFLRIMVFKFKELLKT